jgi:hypothetical protein
MKPSAPLSILLSAFCGLVMFVISCAICVAQTNSQAGCLSYEPSIVKVEGKLTRKTFPGPPNYESVRKGDRPETYWLLDLERPVCIDQDPKNTDFNGAQKDIRLVQLVIDPEMYKEHAGLIGKRVVATGTLFGAITGHHHTPVLLNVTTLGEP